MVEAGFTITTDRLILRPWSTGDADAFASMNADAEVMADLGGPLPRAASDAKLERFRRSLEVDDITRWVVTDPAGRFLGYCGAVAHDDDHPLGAHHDIGWRLARSAWGRGYATEAAAAALADAFDRLGLDEVLAYTSADNVRSQSVMAKLGLARRPERDFVREYDDVGGWTGLVWVATSAI
ncbi:MAG: GNAT family N-acetyltransferase [Actinomycetota bacterium]